MIWFACKTCHKVIGRAESSAGAVVFCDCGASLRVPWESTATPPPIESMPVATPAQTLEPIRFEPTSSRSEPRGGGRRSKHAPIDPEACFNHPSLDKSAVCPECGLSFCERCVTQFQGVPMCAACKNYRTRLLQRRPESSRMALGSFLIALAAAPGMIAMVAATASRHTQQYLLLAIIPPLLALAAGVVALRWIRGAPGRSGEQLALSGIALAAIVAITTMLFVVYGQKVWAGG
jgi:hypothetical protein